MLINLSRIKGLFFICLGVFSSQVFGQPVVSKMTFDANDNKITITGSGFGAGPRVVLFDDFEHGGLEGTPVDPLAASLSWTSRHQYYPPLYDARSHSGESSSLMYDMSNTRARQLSKEFDTPVRDVFVSFWVNVPQGTYFPGSTTTSFNQFPSDSSWKFSWLIDEDTGTESSNVCAPTHVGQGIFMIAGNDMNIMRINDNQWWSWNGWNRLATTLISNEVDATDVGYAEFSALSLENGFWRQSENTAVYDVDGAAEKSYKTLNVPGWIRNSGSNLVETLYDDVYVAVGPNAAKRIELTNNESYGSISMAAIQIVETWTDNEIVFTPREGGLTSLASSSVHFIDERGEPTYLGKTPMIGNALPSPPPAVKTSIQ